VVLIYIAKQFGENLDIRSTVAANGALIMRGFGTQGECIF
jgi:hypothetical protein